MEFKKALKKRKKQWTSKEEELVVEIWAEHIRDLRGARKNSHVLEIMKCELQKYGCEVSIIELKSKLHNLTTKYRKEKALVGPSGGSPSTWILYYRVHSIIGNFKINNVENLVEESIQDVSMIDLVEIEVLEDYSELNIDYNSSSVSLPPTPRNAESFIFPSSSTASTPTPPAGKKNKKINFQNEILKRIDKMDEKISEQNSQLKKMDEKMYNIEVKKTELLEKFVKSSEEIKNAMVDYLKKNLVQNFSA